ncbi:MAG: FAD-dependent oxidoreductase, partial [Myxococcales bacterium]|nr:FAD-dependent oxidoreductase [Myxococcales bacterium]
MRVVIVGGGIMGCASAYALARAGAEVIVLERAVPGAEASSAAAG